MKKFPVNKKITQIPLFLGFPLKMGYSFIGICFFLVLVLLFSGFTLKKLALILGLVALVYLVFILLSSRRSQNLEKMILSKRIKIKAIKNNSLEPFKDGSKNK